MAHVVESQIFVALHAAGLRFVQLLSCFRDDLEYEVESENRDEEIKHVEAQRLGYEKIVYLLIAAAELQEY